MALLQRLDKFPAGLVAVPALDMMHTDSCEAFVALRCALPPGSGMMFFRGMSSPAASRNALIERFLQYPQFEWIFFIDQDMTPEQHTVAQLMSHGKDVVSAMSFQRHPPHM